MSTTTATETHAEHVEHHDLGFIRTYIFSTDHKMIARQFLFTSLMFLLLGGLCSPILNLGLLNLANHLACDIPRGTCQVFAWTSYLTATKPHPTRDPPIVVTPFPWTV